MNNAENAALYVKLRRDYPGLSHNDIVDAASLALDIGETIANAAGPYPLQPMVLAALDIIRNSVKGTPTVPDDSASGGE